MLEMDHSIPGVSNLQLTGWMRHDLATPTPGLAKEEKVVIHHMMKMCHCEFDTSAV